MPLHAPEMGRDTRRQLFFTGFAHRPHAGVNAAAARGDLERPRTHLDAGCSRGARERGAAARAIPFPGARAGTVRLLAFLGIYGTHRARFPPRGRSVDVRHIALDVDVRVRVRAKNGRPSVPRGFVVRAAA